MSVIAKFRCDNVDMEKGEVILSPVYDSNPDSENGRFFKLTPWGSIRMGTINEAALKQFEVGGEYFITFEKANKNE